MLSRRSRSFALASCACTLALTLAAHAEESAPSGPLDGRTYSGEAGLDGDDSGAADTLVFVAGTFRSTHCDPYGFTAVPYTAETREGRVHFHAVATSEQEGTMEWHGAVNGDAIEGSGIWTKPGDSEGFKIWFRAALEAPAAADTDSGE